jgi:hypothetical protein
MALVLADRVKETTTSTGTGTITLAGASSGFQSFSVVGDGNTTYYAIVGQGVNEWEVGIGTYTASGTTLSRDTVLASSAGGTTKVTFSAGTKDVFVTYPSSKSLYYQDTGGVVINESNSSTALRITNTGTGNSLVVEDSANPDSTPFVINPSGIIVHGTTGSVPVSGVAEYEQLHGINSGTASRAGAAWSAASASTASSYTFARSRGSSVGDYTTVNSGDTIGLIQFRAADGTQMVPSAYIVGQVDGTPGTNDMPGRLLFSTTADGASSPTERLRINANGPISMTGLTLNKNTIATNVTVGSGYNATSAGPVTINSGITVTVDTDSRWVIV